MTTVLGMIAAIMYTIVACRVFGVLRRRKACTRFALCQSAAWPLLIIVVGMLSLMIDDYRLPSDMSEDGLKNTENTK